MVDLDAAGRRLTLSQRDSSGMTLWSSSWLENAPSAANAWPLRPELVDARDDSQAAVLLGRLVDVDRDRHQVVVRVREERVVLVPLEAGLAAGRRLQVELRVVELDVRPDERLDGSTIAVEDGVVTPRGRADGDVRPAVALANADPVNA